MIFTEYNAPCGKLLIGVHGDKVCLCDWMRGERIERTLRRIHKFISPAECPDDPALFDNTRSQLDEYFWGKLKSFDVPMEAFGSEFQRRVWVTLQTVPYGVTVSYQAITEMIGTPGGIRAVASAIGANPLSILIPCHRIIGADGKLHGYAGGLEVKSYLLQFESVSFLTKG